MVVEVVGQVAAPPIVFVAFIPVDLIHSRRISFLDCSFKGLIAIVAIVERLITIIIAA